MSGEVTAEKVLEQASSMTVKKVTGSAYNAYNIEGLWDLGESLRQYEPGLQRNLKLAKLERLWDKTQKEEFDTRFYRAAITARNYFEKRDGYVALIKSINTWGKLREVYPLLERVGKTDSQLNEYDIENLIRNAKNATYEEVRTLAKQLRLKGDPIFQELGIDTHDMQKMLMSSCREMREKLEAGDEEFYTKFRQDFNADRLLAIRTCLSGIQNTQVYEKYSDKIRRASQVVHVAKNPDIADLVTLCSNITKLAASERGRTESSAEIGSNLFAELSTLMKAMSSGEERTRYLRNQETLRTFLGGGSN